MKKKKLSWERGWPAEVVRKSKESRILRTAMSLTKRTVMIPKDPQAALLVVLACLFDQCTS